MATECLGLAGREAGDPPSPARRDSFPSSPCFSTWVAGEKQVAGWVGSCASPFWRAKGYASKQEENSHLCQLYYTCQSHPGNGYDFSPVFGSQTRPPVAEVQEQCKYFDPDLCSQLNGLSCDFIPRTPSGVLLLWNGEGSNSGY